MSKGIWKNGEKIPSTGCVRDKGAKARDSTYLSAQPPEMLLKHCCPSLLFTLTKTEHKVGQHPNIEEGAIHSLDSEGSRLRASCLDGLWLYSGHSQQVNSLASLSPGAPPPPPIIQESREPPGTQEMCYKQDPRAVSTSVPP